MTNPLKLYLFMLICFGFTSCTPEEARVSNNYTEFNETLEIALGKKLASRKEYLEWIVDYKNDSQEGRAALKRLAELDHQVLELLTELENLKYQLQQLPAEDKSFVQETFIQNQKGAYLEEKLNDFVDALYQEFKDAGIKKSDDGDFYTGSGYITYLAQGNENDPVFQGLPSASKGFVEVHFSHTTAIEVISYLLNLQLSILLFEEEVHIKLSPGDITREINPPQIKAAASTPSQIIEAGETYQAKLYLSKENQLLPVFIIDNEVQQLGQNPIPFKIQKPQTGEQSWEGELNYIQGLERFTKKAQGKLQVTPNN